MKTETWATVGKVLTGIGAVALVVCVGKKMFAPSLNVKEFLNFEETNPDLK